MLPTGWRCKHRPRHTKPLLPTPCIPKLSLHHHAQSCSTVWMLTTSLPCPLPQWCRRGRPVQGAVRQLQLGAQAPVTRGEATPPRVAPTACFAPTMLGPGSLLQHSCISCRTAIIHCHAPPTGQQATASHPNQRPSIAANQPHASQRTSTPRYTMHMSH